MLIFVWNYRIRVGSLMLFRFVDLSAVLEPGRPAKTDKPAILDDAIRVLTQLRAETQELTQTNEKLLEEIKSLKVIIAHLLLKLILFLT